MKKINILTKSVYNRIAAGEVVDRPYSAVKELIENSLDAGATQIDIYIEGGGKNLIKVVDNGCGIERDDLCAAFFPHATSKISCADDLNNIMTLGFRGEALASIASVSKIELTSVTAGNCAYSVTCEGGKVGQVVPAAFERGTAICVRNLFYNTPVRAKFLKTDKKEESDITNFVTRYILGNPHVSFCYYVDGKLTLQSFGGGLDEALAQVYGAKVISECYKINAAKDGIVISGFIGNQNYFKSNKTYQSLFLNGRYIVNNTVSTAVSNAYASYAMKRQYPFYVLNISVPTEMVDVNVHPNKFDVRFLDNRLIFGAVYSVVSSVLDGTASAAKFIVDSVRIPEIKSTSDSQSNKVYGSDIFEKPDTDVNENLKNETEENKKIFDPFKKMVIFDDHKPVKMTISNKLVSEGFDNYVKPTAVPLKSAPVQQKIEVAECVFKGSLFNTYLIYEYGETAYIIDQHAAHERIIYDRLIAKMESRKIERQSMLIPYLFGANPQEAEFIENNIEIIRNMGFDLKPFGVGSYRVDEVPADLQDINLQDFFNDLLSDLKNLREIKLESMLKDKIATKACKHAVKGGMRLTDAEVYSLLNLMDGDTGLKCPHGRPVCVALNKNDIEKMFKRIV